MYWGCIYPSREDDPDRYQAFLDTEWKDKKAKKVVKNLQEEATP